MKSDWTTVSVRKPTAKRLRKSAIDAEKDIQEHATEALEKGLSALRMERLSQGHNTTTGASWQ